MSGGLGRDTYVVDNTGDRVLETGLGVDLVQSLVSFTLGSNVENLTLVGTAALNGTGNGLANTILGNSNKNILKGAGGGDTLNGGNGKDTIGGDGGKDTITGGGGGDNLSGGAASDLFDFNKAHGKDVITDFRATGKSHDILDLSDISGIKHFKDLMANHVVEKGSDVIIKTGGSHSIRLEDVDLGDLTNNDFLF
ncbi:hypothetical protein LXM94_17110 [Rhizobium sp. TRM95111]|uniref:hypothetical protein n=1 Tax=Rhizobium alarense TaxID=2846851 RepID=UPI001F278FA1|nr:hypothetical protein [Rhizobium alarense]MCF3641694.1 hypothetical protein [Rhizobium alarense]